MGIEKWMKTSSNKPSLSFGLLNVELLQKWNSLDQAIYDTSNCSIKRYSFSYPRPFVFPCRLDVSIFWRFFKFFSSVATTPLLCLWSKQIISNHWQTTNFLWNQTKCSWSIDQYQSIHPSNQIKPHWKPRCWMHPVEPVCRGKHLFLLFQQWICAKLLLKQRLQLL